MPFTPYHWGLTILIYAIFFFLDPVALFLGSTIPDFEGFLARYLKMGNPVHGILHTLIGGILEAVLIFLLSFLSWREIEKRLDSRLKTFLHYFYLPPDPSTIAVSAILGVYSHILLDALIYSDLYLFWPISEMTPLSGLIPVSAIYPLCFVSAFVGIILINLRVRKITAKQELNA